MKTEAEVRQALADLLARDKKLQHNGAMHYTIKDYARILKWILGEQPDDVGWYLDGLRAWASQQESENDSG